MLSGSSALSSSRALLSAWFLLMSACGGQAVDASGKSETTGSGSNPSDATAGMQTAETGGSSGGAGGGGGATGSSSEHRDAARARAARFVNDPAVPCDHQRVTFLESGAGSAYPVRVLQRRGRGSPYLECAEFAEFDERLACWQRLSCDFDWWNALDWSQWSPDATVVEVVGPRPERINVARTKFQSLPETDGTRIWYVSFYEPMGTGPPESTPPGCHDCGYYWYLDPTPDGVALVLGPPLAADLEGGLPFTELELCLTE